MKKIVISVKDKSYELILRSDLLAQIKDVLSEPSLDAEAKHEFLKTLLNTNEFSQWILSGWKEESAEAVESKEDDLECGEEGESIPLLSTSQQNNTININQIFSGVMAAYLRAKILHEQIYTPSFATVKESLKEEIIKRRYVTPAEYGKELALIGGSIGLASTVTAVTFGVAWPSYGIVPLVYAGDKVIRYGWRDPRVYEEACEEFAQVLTQALLQNDKKGIKKFFHTAMRDFSKLPYSTFGIMKLVLMEVVYKLKSPLVQWGLLMDMLNPETVVCGLLDFHRGLLDASRDRTEKGARKGIEEKIKKAFKASLCELLKSPDSQSENFNKLLHAYFLKEFMQELRAAISGYKTKSGYRNIQIGRIEMAIATATTKVDSEPENALCELKGAIQHEQTTAQTYHSQKNMHLFKRESTLCRLLRSILESPTYHLYVSPDLSSIVTDEQSPITLGGAQRDGL